VKDHRRLASLPGISLRCREAPVLLENSAKVASVLDLNGPHQYASMAIADEASGDKTMHGMKGMIVIATIIATVAVTACRREVPHEPMKLGADVPAAAQVR
jgi:hypothetical protein